MTLSKIRTYRTNTTWTGNLGPGTSQYTAYSRNHEIGGSKKAAPIHGSSDPAFRGDPSRYNPEELLLGALSACHMLWVLHLCADAGIVVTEYSDEAVGEIVEHSGGASEFTRVTLHPRMIISDAGRIQDAAELHHQAHAVCCLARSMNFPVENEPTVTAAATEGG